MKQLARVSLILLAIGALGACGGGPPVTPTQTPLLPVTTPPPAAPTPVVTPTETPGQGSLTPEPGATFPEETGAPQEEVSIVDFGYEPASLEVSAGTPVLWMNGGNAPHTVTFDDGSVDSGTLASGDTFEHTFASAGEFEYFCAIHPSMRGTVVVGP